MWIILSLIYALTNAVYTNYNDKRRYNGYILGIWRGFGISLLVAPLLWTISLNIKTDYLIILIIQGILIGIYDSRIFFASARFGGHTGSGFMATAVLITASLWWALEPDDFKSLLQIPTYFITLIFILCAYSISYWNMMQFEINKTAEKYLYPAVFALALMSIATRYIALKSGNLYTGIICYLTVACFISGIYNSVMYIKTKKKIKKSHHFPKIKDGLKLVFLSMILISAKTAAMRLCPNPAYVVAVLLTSPIIAEIIATHRLKMTPPLTLTLLLLTLLLFIVT